MQELLSSIIQKVQAQSGSYNDLQFIEALDDAALAALGQALLVRLPKSFKEALGYYGKTISHPKFKHHIISIPHYGEMGLVSEQQLLAVYQLLKASDYIRVVDHDCEAVGRNHFWNPRWIPVAAYANWSIHDSLMHYDMLVLDETSLLYGSIIHWHHRAGAIRIVSPSFEQYLSKFHQDLDHMDWDETYGFSF